MRGSAEQYGVAHGDETEWRENGQNGYAGAFVTDGPQAVRYFEFDHSRSHRIARRIMEASFSGWLVTDVYVAYNLIPGRHQRYGMHLLCDCMHSRKRRRPIPRCWRGRRLCDISIRIYAYPCCALARRVLRHQDELFQCVLASAGAPADNNLAERSIRPLVIMRKISGGPRSAAGTKTRLTLASLLGTWAARNLNPFVAYLRA